MMVRHKNLRKYLSFTDTQYSNFANTASKLLQNITLYKNIKIMHLKTWKHSLVKKKKEIVQTVTKKVAFHSHLV